MPDIPQPPTPIGAGKPGYKTTEFWITVLTAVGSALGQVGGFVPPPWGAILVGVSTLAYTISRGLAKSGTTTGP